MYKWVQSVPLRLIIRVTYIKWKKINVNECICKMNFTEIKVNQVNDTVKWHAIADWSGDINESLVQAGGSESAELPPGWHTASQPLWLDGTAPSETVTSVPPVVHCVFLHCSLFTHVFINLETLPVCVWPSWGVCSSSESHRQARGSWEDGHCTGASMLSCVRHV